ncbi:putative callose synthase 6 [Vicia villosa]|uniref:putative callose synthase 6 n=1 Tax=Vicia villosa TaxID=3911 RepID=UPI00273C6C99|nr:putative callose synthase 6 [Vicia villosa]XP_058725726.1 putative callose synthase 6 [Vicia villosa]
MLVSGGVSGGGRNMASASGTKGPFEISRQPSKRMIREPTRTFELPNEENIMNGEIVPSSLDVLVPILRAAIGIELENPRVVSFSIVVVIVVFY